MPMFKCKIDNSIFTQKWIVTLAVIYRCDSLKQCSGKTRRQGHPMSLEPFWFEFRQYKRWPHCMLLDAGIKLLQCMTSWPHLIPCFFCECKFHLVPLLWTQISYRMEISIVWACKRAIQWQTIDLCQLVNIWWLFELTFLAFLSVMQ